MKNSATSIDPFFEVNLNPYLYSTDKIYKNPEYHFDKYDCYVQQRISWSIYMNFLLRNETFGIKELKGFSKYFKDESVIEKIFQIFIGDDFYLIYFLLMSIKLYCLYEKHLDPESKSFISPNIIFFKFFTILDIDNELLLYYIRSKTPFLEYLLYFLKYFSQNQDEKLKEILEMIYKTILTEKGKFVNLILDHLEFSTKVLITKLKLLLP